MLIKRERSSTRLSYCGILAALRTWPSIFIYVRHARICVCQFGGGGGPGGGGVVLAYILETHAAYTHPLAT